MATDGAAGFRYVLDAAGETLTRVGIAADTRAGLELCWEPWVAAHLTPVVQQIALPCPEPDVDAPAPPQAGQAAVDVATTPSARLGRGGVAMENDTMMHVTLEDFLEQAQAAAQAHTRSQTEMWKTQLAGGAALLAAKERGQHGDWLPFLERAGIHSRKAQRWMAFASSGVTVEDLQQEEYFLDTMEDALDQIEAAWAALERLRDRVNHCWFAGRMVEVRQRYSPHHRPTRTRRAAVS